VGPRQRLCFCVLRDDDARRITVSGGIAVADRVDATRGGDGRFAIAVGVGVAIVRTVRDRFGLAGTVAVAVAYAGGIALAGSIGEPVGRAVAFTGPLAVAVAYAGPLAITVAKSVAGPLAVAIAYAGPLAITIAPGGVAVTGSIALAVAGDADRPRDLRQRRPMGTDSRCKRVFLPGSERIHWPGRDGGDHHRYGARNQRPHHLLQLFPNADHVADDHLRSDRWRRRHRRSV